MENAPSPIPGLVLGIVGIVFAFIFWPVGLVCSIIGLVLSNKCRKIEPSGMATAGFVLSLIGLIVSVICLIVVVACLGTIGAAACAAADLAVGGYY